MTKKEVSFVHNGESLPLKVEPVTLPAIGEWVQLRVKGDRKTYLVKHVLHKFVDGFGGIKDPIHRVIILLEEIKEEN